MFETITEEDLGRANGGVSMKLTQFGYRNDPYMRLGDAQRDTARTRTSRRIARSR